MSRPKPSTPWKSVARKKIISHPPIIEILTKESVNGRNIGVFVGSMPGEVVSASPSWWFGKLSECLHSHWNKSFYCCSSNFVRIWTHWTFCSLFSRLFIFFNHIAFGSEKFESKWLRNGYRFGRQRYAFLPWSFVFSNCRHDIRKWKMPYVRLFCWWFCPRRRMLCDCTEALQQHYFW